MTKERRAGGKHKKVFQVKKKKNGLGGVDGEFQKENKQPQFER